MKFQVIYFSKLGNTKKVAKAISLELSVESENVKAAELKDDCLVFLGSGCYGSKPAKLMVDFIENNDFNSRNVVLFGTSGSGNGLEVSEMENMLKDKGANIKGKFFCKGKFLFLNRGKPSNEDYNNVKKFAKDMRQ
jgi:flavodoxin I